MSGGPVRVSRDHLDFVAILKQSIVRTDEMRKVNTSYGRTSPEMNDVGLLGEHAVHWYLSGQTTGVSFTREGDFKSGDVQVSRPYIDMRGVSRLLGIEVKTSRHKDWKRYGRALNARQLHRMNTLVVVWCVVADELPTTSVVIMGWLPTEVIKTATTNQQATFHGQPHVRVQEPMRAPADLVPWIDSLDMTWDGWF